MGKKDDLHALRTSREFVAWAKRHGCDIRYSKGSHVQARKNGITATIPNHPGDLATGTRRAIIKMFVAMGIAVLVLALLIGMMVKPPPRFRGVKWQ